MFTDDSVAGTSPLPVLFCPFGATSAQENFSLEKPTRLHFRGLIVWISAQYRGVGSGVGKSKRCRFGVVLAAFLAKFALSGGEFGVTCCTTFLACEMLNIACFAVKPTRFS